MQWLAYGHRPRRGHTIEIIRRDEMGVHSIGLRLPQVQLPHLLPHIPRDELDGRLHFGHHACGFGDAIEARRAEAFLLSNSANRGDVLLDIPRNELAVTTHAALQVHKVVGVADGANALGDLLTLPGETLVLLARGLHVLRHLLQARGRLWWAARTALVQLVVRV